MPDEVSPKEMEVAQQIAHIAALRAQLTALQANLRDEQLALLIFDPDIKAQWLRLEEIVAAQVQDLQSQIEEVADRVKQSVLELGHTVASADDAGLSAVWSKGQVKWNDASLLGYAAAHPEIKAFRSEGKPSVALR
jgi:hypothetical protein